MSHIKILHFDNQRRLPSQNIRQKWNNMQVTALTWKAYQQ